MVFTNVSKGNVAKTKDLLEAFGKADTLTICKEILNKGELQVSEHERAAQFERYARSICCAD